MSRKSQRQKDVENRSTGGLLFSLFLAACCAVLGFMLGVAHLALIPTQTVRRLPAADERNPRMVYYVQPPGGTSATYDVRVNELSAGPAGTIRVSLADMNSWSAATFSFVPPTEDESNIAIIPSAPRFNIVDGMLNVSTLLEVKAYGKSYKLLLQTQGTFIQTGTGVEFVPTETCLGSARLPSHVVAPMVNDFIFQVFTSSEVMTPLVRGWDQLSDVSIEGDTLKLVKS